MSRGHNKAQLSKQVLEMKFMKRTKEKYEKDQFAADAKALFSTSLTEQLDGKQARLKRFVQENSFVPCADLVAGRMSFKGRNPWIEKLAAKEEAADPTRGKMGGMDDEEFVDRYSSTVDTMSKKFLRKRDRNETGTDQQPPKAKRFKRPQLDN